jgi:hypothetical protein
VIELPDDNLIALSFTCRAHRRDGTSIAFRCADARATDSSFPTTDDGPAEYYATQTFALPH